MQTPTALTLHEKSRELEIQFEDGRNYRLPFEFLRISSPSAEVRGHGPGQEVLQTGKRDVMIVGVEPVGHYGLRPIFSDGHDSGIYTWDYLAELGAHQVRLWESYLAQLAAADASRDSTVGSGQQGNKEK